MTPRCAVLVALVGLLATEEAMAGPKRRAASPVESPEAMAFVLELDASMRERMVGVSWHPGCPVSLDDLRAVEVPYVDFAGVTKRGLLVVHRRVAKAVGGVFVELHRARFPIERIQPIDEFGGDDERSMAANNTSAFNCRRVAGSTTWSRHSYGEAIDVNPLQNPYVTRTVVSPPQSALYADRTVKHPGLITADGPVVRAFARIGWKWGGHWTRLKDWQHFSSDGR